MNTIPHPIGGGGGRGGGVGGRCLKPKDNKNADVIASNPLELMFLPVNRQAVHGDGRGSSTGVGRERVTGVFNK